MRGMRMRLRVPVHPSVCTDVRPHTRPPARHHDQQSPSAPITAVFKPVLDITESPSKLRRALTAALSSARTVLARSGQTRPEGPSGGGRTVQRALSVRPLAAVRALGCPPYARQPQLPCPGGVRAISERGAPADGGLPG